MPEVVADVGNTRIKWGLCSDDGLARTIALPLADPNSWVSTFQAWNLSESSTWALAGTQPDVRNNLAEWLKLRGCKVRVIDDYRVLPIDVRVDQPEQVGVDRLLNAIAIKQRATPAIVVDAGSAITVDLIDRAGAFRGGAILPGFRLMARSLNDYTAKLPLVDNFPAMEAPAPGLNTIAAITAGITSAIQAGIDRLVQRLSSGTDTPRVFITGGDAHLLHGLQSRPEVLDPFLTLEGLRIVSRALS